MHPPGLPPASVAVVLLVAVCTAPWWLPAHVVRLRVWLFTLINGPDGVGLPNHALDAAATRRLYEHPGARLRSKQRGVGLSDLFWYLLSPGADVHQEHTESGSGLHGGVSAATKVLLGVPPAELQRYAEAAVAWRLRMFRAEPPTSSSCRVVRLREWVFPMVARFWWQVCFGHVAPEDTTHDGAIHALAASGADVIDALKGLRLRDMRVRDAATLAARAAMDDNPASRATAAYAPALAAGVLSPHEAALALQGVIFHTGTVQLSDALTHLALALAQYAGPPRAADDADGSASSLSPSHEHRGCSAPTRTGRTGHVGLHESGWDRVAREGARRGPAVSTTAAEETHDADGNRPAAPCPAPHASPSASSPDAGAGDPGQAFLERSMHESFRVWPLFGVAHRITDRDILIAPSSAAGSDRPVAIPSGSVLCFDYTALHAAGIADSPGRFLPDRWTSLRGKDLPAYTPFGVPRNRPCPAQRVCLEVIPVFTRALASGVRVWSSADHTRALPGRGLAVVQLRSHPRAAATAGNGPSSETAPPSPTQLRLLLAAVRALDLLDGLRLSLTQLVCGTLLVLQARSASLAHRYHTAGITPRGESIPLAQR